MWNEYVIDATMGASNGLFCFCPVERGLDGEIENIVTGMNYVGAPPGGARIIAVVHEDGQEAVERFCEEHKQLLDKVFASGMEAHQGGDPEEGRHAKHDSPAPKGDAP